MNRSDFKQKLSEALISKGVTTSVPQLKSALDKTARHASAKYGSVDWQMEYDECGTDNAEMFYHEYKSQQTFNRDGYQRSRQRI